MGNCIDRSDASLQSVPDEPAPEVYSMGLQGRLGPKNFKKIKLLGKGATARVFLVEYTKTREVYALKVVSKAEMIARHKVSHILTEKEVLSASDHPFIVSLYASFQTDEYLFFVMEYCPTQFFPLLKSMPNCRLDETYARFCAAEVVLGLEYLHKRGFMYRDLKPENILMSGDGHLRLTDFDLAARIITPEQRSFDAQSGAADGGADGGDEQQQKYTQFAGTPEYIAPEIIAGLPYDAAVDWWAFGILLFEMLYGFTPFASKSQRDSFQVGRMHFQFPAQPLVSREAKELIGRLLTRSTLRLGVNGAREVKQAKWFADINWDRVAFMTPPLNPQLYERSLAKEHRSLKQQPVADDGFDWRSFERVSVDEKFPSFSFERRH